MAMPWRRNVHTEHVRLESSLLSATRTVYPMYTMNPAIGQQIIKSFWQTEKFLFTLRWVRDGVQMNIYTNRLISVWFHENWLTKKREEKYANHSNPNGNTPPEKRASKKVVDFYRCRWFGSDLPKNTKWRHSCYSNCIICCSHCKNKSNKNHSEENLLTCHGFGEKNELAPKYGDTLKPLRWLVRVFSRLWRLCLSVSHLIFSFAGVSSRTSNDDNELRL